MKVKVLKIKFLINSIIKYNSMLSSRSISKIYALIPFILVGLVAITFGLAYSFLPSDHTIILNEGMKITDEITVIKNGG